MRKLLAAMLVALLMAGCGGEVDLDDKETLDEILAEAIDGEKMLRHRGKEGERLAYALNEETPYSGWAKKMRDNGQIEALEHWKDGKRDGLGTWWHGNGQKLVQFNWKDGKEDGITTLWYENGQKKVEATYKRGKFMTAVAWKPNGVKCPVTNVNNGNGVLVYYNKDGTELRRNTVKDGEEVED